MSKFAERKDSKKKGLQKGLKEDFGEIFKEDLPP